MSGLVSHAFLLFVELAGNQNPFNDVLHAISSLATHSSVYLHPWMRGCQVFYEMKQGIADVRRPSAAVDVWRMPEIQKSYIENMGLTQNTPPLYWFWLKLRRG